MSRARYTNNGSNMYNYYEAKETMKNAATFAGGVAIFTAATYGGSKVGHAIIDAAEDLTAAGMKKVGKVIKKKIRKKKFGFF